MRSIYSFVMCSFLLSGCIVVQKPTIPVKQVSNKSPYRQINLEEMVRRYIAKSHQGESSIEGIYTVSGEVMKKSRSLLSNRERERTVDKKVNYATVAILKDWPGSNTEYVEISLQGNNASNYPIISEISSLAGGHGYIFNHMDRKGKQMSFTFLSEGSQSDVLEGVFTETLGNATITYKLSYLKTYPKNKNFATDN